jgi:hypothetical protein
MSVQAISWALSVRAGSPSAKCTLLCIANYADEYGKCWPSQATISRQSEQSVDTVQRRVKDLEKAGLLSRTERAEQNGRRGGRYFYQLSIATKDDPLPVETAPQSAARFNGSFKNHTANHEKPHRTVAVQTTILEPSIIDRKKEIVGQEKRKGWSPPKHGQIAKDKNLIYIEKQRADEWNAYAEDFRRAKGVEPQPTKAGGHWFKITGEAA